ncbi:MAG: tetratricopeptide repeat protein [Acidobacteria bacterium]|nr:tetratricopeptide repeat protein [Acidobacteriota bacterium]MCW5967346.1 tetratricopeptide repeat protein [Blastocatellales bacterium]
MCAGCRGRGELLEQAQAAWDASEYETAAQHFEEFLKSNPHHDQSPPVRFRLGNIYYYNLRQYEKAIQQYIHVLEDFPSSPDVLAARERLAECYSAIGKHREAINEYESLLSTAPGAVDGRRIRLKIADLYYELNDLGQALAEYDKVVREGEYDPIAERSLLRVAGIRLLRDEFDEALAAYRTVAERTSEVEVRRVARLGMVDCYERMFEYDLAVKTLDETEPDPVNPEYNRRRVAAIREQQRQRNFSNPSSPRL